MRNKLAPIAVFLLACLVGYFMPAKLAAQAPAVLFAMNNGVPQPIRSTGNALWVTVAGGSGTFTDIIARSVTGLTNNATPNLTLTGGTSTNGTGGALLVNGGDATTNARNGGAIALTSGSGLTTGRGGDIDIVVGDSGASGNGGALSLESGDGNGGSSAGGNIDITSGDGASSGGNITITSGSGAANGEILLAGGSGSAITMYDEGDIQLHAGMGKNVYLDPSTGDVLVKAHGGAYGAIDAGTYKINGTALGAWTNVVFSAGDYTANGSMTWTVASGDVTTNQYIRIDNLLIWNLVLDTTTVGGTPDTQLRVDIPGSVTLTKSCVAFSPQNDNGTEAGGDFVGVAGNSYIYFKKIPSSNWSASTNNTAVYAQIICEVS